MNQSIALIALAVATLSGAVNAAPAHAALLDQTASTSSSTVWSTGELGFVQNRNAPINQKVAPANTAANVDASIDVAAKTSPSTIFTLGEVGYVQNPNYSAATKGTGVSVAMAKSQAMALQGNVKTFKDVTITF